MITVIIGLIAFIISAIIITPLLWFSIGKILKIENLTFKKAFYTFLLLGVISVLLKIVETGMLSLKINETFTDLVFLIAGIVISITIFTKRFNTTIVKSFGLYFSTLFIAVCLALILRLFFVQAYKMPTGSMLDTLQIGDHILVNKFIYLDKPDFVQNHLFPQRRPVRDDLIVFTYPLDERDFIKRVVGVAGDTIEIKDKKVYINGEWEGEKPYELFNDSRHYARDISRENFEKTWKEILAGYGQIRPDPALARDLNLNSDYGEITRFFIGNFRDNFGPVTVPQGQFFVMGDNRDNSHDSRFWGFVPLESVKGKVFVIYWSWDSINSNVRWDRIGRSL